MDRATYSRRHETSDSPPLARPPLAWVDAKLSGYEEALANVVVEVRDPTRLRLPERNALLARLRKLNFVIYQCRADGFNKNHLKALGVQLGLSRLDNNLCADTQAISSVCASNPGSASQYIPYTDRPLGWHTDGYYNAPSKAIRSFVLHCVSPALLGGDNWLLDPEIVYLLLNEKGEQYPAALADPEAFSIPAGRDPGAEPESGRTGPVFTIDPLTGSLHMRYTARRRSINWSPKPGIAAAAEALRETIDQASRYTLRHKLEPGQGVICNNVLHRRAGFVDGTRPGERRLMYRARYYDRVLST